MSTPNIHGIRNDLRRYLAKIRQESDAIARKQNTLDPRWSDAAKRSAMQVWRSESAAKLDEVLGPVTGLVKDGLSLQDHWSTRAYLKRQRLTKGNDDTQSAILEQLTLLNVRQELPRLSKEELGNRVDSAIEGQRWGELGVLLSECESRQRSDPGEAAWLLLATTIERTRPPEVEDALSTITEIRQLAQWVQSARQSLATGERDVGLAMEESLIASRERASGDEAGAKARMRIVIDRDKNAA